ncbi:MAG: hypothetical protein WDZ80_01370 [Candidatus Paceibacterota bacterium]
MTLDSIGLFIMIAGFILGLGAVTVIDFHGFLARKSKYWTKATIRAHKITKPLIWVGMTLLIIGGFILYRKIGFTGIPVYQSLIALILLLNGVFLSFYISPKLLKREREGKDDEVLPKTLQEKIVVSFIVSFLGWWFELLFLVFYLIHVYRFIY